MSFFNQLSFYENWFSRCLDPEPSQDHSAKNVAFDNEASPPSESLLTRRQWITRANRQRGNLDEVEYDLRAFRHAHIIRRPHAMQHFHQHEKPKERRSRSNSAGSGEGEARSTDSILIQLARLDLFIDLIWVGIVANLSATFSAQAFSDSGVSQGQAFLEYFLLFHAYLATRNFMVWILVLSVLYGINAPYAFTPDHEGESITLLITIYLVARGSFLCAYVLQSLFLPFLRRQVLFRIVTASAIGGIWIAAILVGHPGKLALLIEHSPDVEHFIERIEGFFVIILGEGIFRLSEGSPSGIGLNARSGTVLTALLFFHIVIFGALLILAASVLFLVEHPGAKTSTTTTESAKRDESTNLPATKSPI
ncbi:hypothetical protein BDZ45DRAFT_740370 [Acephala macrosclerotiorum]|nr:hypothetical protein BDZ45DRAFT_740370 [Acephala macrosclerotiorum]